MKNEGLEIEPHKLKQSYADLKASYEAELAEHRKSDDILLSIKLAIHNSREVIFLTDEEGIFSFVNPEFTVMYGFTEEEVIGKATPRILNSGLFPKEVFEPFWQTLKSKQAIPVAQYVNKRKNGELVDVEGSADPIINESGDLVGFLGIQRDITKRKFDEQALKENQIDLLELNATKDKFFSIIAHDLKGPLSTLLGFSDLLKKKIETYDIKTQKKFIHMIHESARNTYDLLENLLEWASIQRGTIKFEPTKENLFLLCEQTFGLLNESAQTKNLHLSSDIPSELVIYADKHMVSAVIRNLVSNAIKFTHRNGEIKISATELIDGDKKYAEISVSDNGVGISPESISNLFCLSENVSSKGTENEKGTGLGLILCKEFIEKHNGKLRVESKLGKGTSFVFTLPVFS